MAFEFTFNDPFTKQDGTGYGYIHLFLINFHDQFVRVDVLNYVSRAAYLVQAQPLNGQSFIVPKEGLPALDDQQRRLFKREDDSYVLEEQKDDPAATPVVPTFPAIPPAMEYVASVVVPEGGLPPGTKLVDYIGLQLYLLLKSRPEFAATVIVDIG